MERQVKRRGEADYLQKNPDKIKFGKRGAPTPAERALIERYKVDNKIDGVINNTLDNIISESIYQIKEAVDNMIAYGDPKVYRILPKELDDKIRTYGWFAQEYFGKGISSAAGQPVYIVPASYIRCSECEKFKSPDSFFVRYKENQSSRVHICKECCNKIFTELLLKYGPKEALIIMCQRLDIVALNDVIEKYCIKYKTPEGKREVSEGAFLGNFFGDESIFIRSNEIHYSDCSFMKSNLHGEPFRDIVAGNQQNPIYDDILAEKDEDDDFDDDNVIGVGSTKRLKRKWGDFEKKDLIWLESKYNEWYEKCEIEGLSREKLVMQLCYEELDIVRTRERGGNVKDKVRSFQSLMKEADLTPKRQVTNSTDSQFSSLGAFIKAAEASGPIVEKNKAFRDIDSFEKFWKSVAGAISRTLCKDNEYVKDFENNYKEYTVDILGTESASTQSTEPTDGDQDGS